MEFTASPQDLDMDIGRREFKNIGSALGDVKLQQMVDRPTCSKIPKTLLQCQKGFRKHVNAACCKVIKRQRAAANRNRRLADMPFEFREVLEINHPLRTGTLRQQLRKAFAVLRDARHTRRMPPDVRLGGFGNKPCSGKPGRRRKLCEERLNETRGVIPLMNGEAIYYLKTVSKKRHDHACVAVDHCVAKSRLEISEIGHSLPPDR